MREPLGTRRPGQIGILLVSVATWATPGCGGTADQSDAQSELGNNAGIGAAAAVTAGSTAAAGSAGKLADASPTMPSVAAMMAGRSILVIMPVS